MNTYSISRTDHFLSALLSLMIMTSLFFIETASAVTREQAKRIHDRIAGVPPSETVLTAMVAQSDIDAAFTAMDNPHFYDVTLKNLIAPWTNESQTVFTALNDYTATIIGMVRDNADIRKILYDDILYVGKASLGLPAYSISNNNHYQALEDQGINLKDNLVATAQSTLTGMPAEATAGILTSREMGKEFYKDGTNRAVFRFTLLNHLCTDLEQLKDTTRPADRVRQDVSRSPGGDSRIFLNSCLGCHSGMDPLTQSLAYYNYDYDVETDPEGENGHLSYNAAGTIDPTTQSRVKAKYHNNATNFPSGYITPNDNWENYWRKGKNSLLGWDSSLPGKGEGAKTMGQELASSEAFAQCQVKKVFKAVCLRSPVDTSDRTQISSMVSSLKNHQYNLKQVFAESAVYCEGD